MNIGEPNNGQSSAEPLRSEPRVHKHASYSLKLLDGRSRANIARALAEGESCRSIARRLHHSIHTVLAVRDADWQQITVRKDRIAAQSERNATRAAELIAQKLEGENVPLNVLVPVFGVSVDKALALRGDGQLRIAFDHSHQHIHAHIRDDRPLSEIIAKLPRRNLPQLPQQGIHAPEDTQANDQPGA